MSPRAANTLGLLVCAGLLAYAYYAQFVMHLEPCPLCIFQRLGVLAIGIAFALAAAHDPARWVEQGSNLILLGAVWILADWLARPRAGRVAAA